MASTTARIVIAATDQTAGAFKTAQAGLTELQRRASTVGSVFGGMGAQIATSLSVAGIGAFVRGTVNAIDALNDAADATGSTIEQLSSLEDVARRNGGTLDDVTGILVKFNQALAGADGKNGVSQAIKAIGLDARELRTLDPADALEQVAVALAGFADDGNKARLVQELFGKSIRDAAPFLKDLAEQGRQNATVTTDQAKAAEQFNKQLFALQASSAALGRQLVSELLPALNTMADRLRGVNTAATESGGLTGALLVPLEAVAVLGVNVAYVFKQIGIEIGGIAAQGAALLRGDFAGVRSIGEQMKADAEAARIAVDERSRQLLGLSRIQKQLASVPQAGFSNEGRNATRRLPDLPGNGEPASGTKPTGLPDLDLLRLGFSTKEIDQIRKQREFILKALDDLKNRRITAKEFEDISLGRLAEDQAIEVKVKPRLDEKLSEVIEDFGKSIGPLLTLDDADFVKAFERVQKAIEATPTGKLEQARREVIELYQAYEQGRFGIIGSTEALEQYIEVATTRLAAAGQVVQPALQQISEFAQQAERNIQNALGDTLKRTLTGDFKSIGQLWRNLLIDMAAQALAADLGRKLFPNGAGGGGSIFSALFSLLGFAMGGAFAGGKVVPFASGGLVNGPTLFPMAGGLGLMGEAGPEAIVPLRRGRDGRLGVAGGGTVVNNVYNVAAGVSRNELVTALQLMQQSIEGRMVSMMRRQGTA